PSASPLFLQLQPPLASTLFPYTTLFRSVGYDGRHVLGVWVGRPDNGAVPGLTGYASAAPILFEGFAKSGLAVTPLPRAPPGAVRDRKSTRLNSSHVKISYAVFCLKKKKN